MVCAYLACCIPLEFINDTLHIIVVTFCLSKILFLVLQGRECKEGVFKKFFLNQKQKVDFFPFHNEVKQCLLLSFLMSESLLKNSKKKYDEFFIWNLFSVIL